MQGGTVDPRISGDGLERGARGVLIQCDGIASELLGVGLAWHDVEITFQSQIVGVLGVYQPGSDPRLIRD